MHSVSLLVDAVLYSDEVVAIPGLMNCLMNSPMNNSLAAVGDASNDRVTRNARIQKLP